MFEQPPSDSDRELERRKSRAILVGRLGLIGFVAAAVVLATIKNYDRNSCADLLTLPGIAIAYLICGHFGTVASVRRVFSQAAVPPPRGGHRMILVVYFVALLGMGGVLDHLAAPAHGVMWLVLLAPVVHAVMLVPGAGVVLVSAASIAILSGNIFLSYGFREIPLPVAGFSLAVLFTVMFTQIGTGAKRSRGEIARLARELASANRLLAEDAVRANELASARERNRLAREVHDSLGHYLTAACIHLEAAQAASSLDQKAARSALATAQSLLRDGLADVRKSVAALRGTPLDGRPLTEALRRLAGECESAGLPAEVLLLGEPRPLAPPVALTLYRVGQEGLTNARKHARATAVKLTVDFRIPGVVLLRVFDDGLGRGAAEPAAAGFGLRGIRERVHLLSGTASAGPLPGGGFALEVQVPS